MQMVITDMKPMVADNSVHKDENGCINPFNQDVYNMGEYVGKNVCIMYPCFENQECHYIIVIDRRTGERKKIQFSDGYISLKEEMEKEKS